MKIRKFKESNYKAIYHNGQTMRLALNRNKPITELEYPEFYDIKITDYCKGNCPYCYQSSTEKGNHFDNILAKSLNFFGDMKKNERPFQVAIGGGNPNEHPTFINLLFLFDSLNITPNYTTNGMGMTDEILDATEKYCGGVAISTHFHLVHYWVPTLGECFERNIKTNLHHIISDRKSTNHMRVIIENFKDQFDYIVLLPHANQGRAEKNKKTIDYSYLEETLDKFSDEIRSKIAYGAGFYEFFKFNG